MIAGKRPSPASSSTGEASEISSASDAVFHFDRDAEEEEEDMANCLILLAEGHRRNSNQSEIFACKTCSKSFPSFQALGGHRASHKKPAKAAQRVDSPPADESPISSSAQISGGLTSDSQNRARVHVCSICGAGFGSGQALGGHMRRHRPATAAANGGQNR
ncbi:hypothetical protein M569_05802, partial [Genlisea aurea]